MEDNNNTNSNKELQKKKRGRPKKNQEQSRIEENVLSISGAEDHTADIEPKRKRGRPKKVVTPEMLASGNIPKEKYEKKKQVPLFRIKCGDKEMDLDVEDLLSKLRVVYKGDLRDVTVSVNIDDKEVQFLVESQIKLD